MKFKLIRFLIVLATCANTISSKAQESDKTLLGQRGDVITTAVPFLSFAPNSRASAMGDVGVATTPDVNSVHWNNGKLAFVDHEMGGSISYSPWLGNIVQDMYIGYLSGYYKIDRVQTVAVSFRYFDLGQIDKTNDFGLEIGSEQPSEVAVDATYSRKLSEKLGIGVTGRFISSNIVGGVADVGKPGRSVAVDLGLYYRSEFSIQGRIIDMGLGLHISNVGQKLNYTDDDDGNFIPTNLRLGSSFTSNLDPYNTLTFAFDLNKLMVPSNQPSVDDAGNVTYAAPDKNLISGMFGSFSDAPGGFSEEIKEITLSTGLEYWYDNKFALRAGYFYEHESKGGRKYTTVGAGFNAEVLTVNMSYLIPGDKNHPLAETIRFSIIMNVNPTSDDSDLYE